MSDNDEERPAPAVPAPAGQTRRRIREDLSGNPVIAAFSSFLIAPVLLTIGILFTDKALTAHSEYAHARSVPGRIVVADYVKTDRTDAEKIVVTLSGSGRTATIDDVISAPDYLVAGQSVDVLPSPTRPGHALFASQLGNGELLLPLAALAAGVVAAGAFVWSCVQTRRLIRAQRELRKQQA